MDWSDEGVILSVRPHGETAAVVEILTRSHGRHLGLVHGGRSRKQRPVLMRNRDGKFADISKQGGGYFGTVHLSRGVALADLDNDGRVDAVVGHMNEPVSVIRNVTPAGNHWVGLTLKGANNADVVGARVRLTAGGRTQTRFAKGGGSYASTPDRRLVFGLGKADKIDIVTVEWPDGKKQEFKDVPTDKYLVLTRDEKEPKPALR